MCSSSGMDRVAPLTVAASSNQTDGVVMATEETAAPATPATRGTSIRDRHTLVTRRP